jgi:hypothetical protein
LLRPAYSLEFPEVKHPAGFIKTSLSFIEAEETGKGPSE